MQAVTGDTMTGEIGDGHQASILDGLFHGGPDHLDLNTGSHQFGGHLEGFPGGSQQFALYRGVNLHGQGIVPDVTVHVDTHIQFHQVSRVEPKFIIGRWSVMGRDIVDGDVDGKGRSTSQLLDAGLDLVGDLQIGGPLLDETTAIMQARVGDLPGLAPSGDLCFIQKDNLQDLLGPRHPNAKPLALLS